ncbi:MAG: peptidase M1 [Niastella sp. SCN 39-18]|nr:M1 family metallopeptidase [Sphingobacteriales bacterium]ODT54100.1 MAG: peptidase M1 [Niastella sp. SCN 39-18]OJW10006.1 MAG: peptidase M1 [Sphingobacteriales bacterium 39-19]
MRKKIQFLLSVICVCSISMNVSAQCYWQQKVNYKMEVDVNVHTNRFTGKQRLEYFNNSPDKLDKVFYHLYWNAFQPNSSMDARSRELGKILINNNPDWDSRVKDRISKLSPEEIGYQKVLSLKLNGVPQPFTVHETILKVNLTQPIMPGQKVIFDMEFEAQVPLQIRRSGRDNPSTQVRYSMSQWYPKMAEYDFEGWHADQYVAREFYGVWGNYDVSIKIDKDYKLGATGVLLNASEIGWGYDKPGTALKPVATAKRTWHFVGNNVHDFVWAADTAYNHLSKKVRRGLTLHVIYKYKPGNQAYEEGWQNVLTAAEKVLPFIENKFGKYPYPQYSFIHGGDGGMEYPMATLIHTSTIGTVFHEWMHSWYQMMLATNESEYPWMDEGFASYAESLVSAYYSGNTEMEDLRKRLEQNPDNKALQNLINSLPENHSGAYNGYFRLVKSNLQEPLTTHADHYSTNFGYSVSSYSKGEIFLEQLGYITGAGVRDKILMEYYNKWRFKHPNVNDFIRIAEAQSGMQLYWYRMYWINTTKYINYAVDSLWQDAGRAHIRLVNKAEMPMPIDVKITYKDGSTEMYNIPLDLMLGNKKNENPAEKYFVEPEWQWTHPEYILKIKAAANTIASIEIDPSKRMADLDRSDNKMSF